MLFSGRNSRAANASHRIGDFRKAVKRQRVALASALIVAVALVGIARAPAVPVFVGCGAAMLLLLVRTLRKLRSF